MPTITLPDNSQREYDNALTVMQVSESIGPGLAKATLGGSVGRDAGCQSRGFEFERQLGRYSCRR